MKHLKYFESTHIYSKIDPSSQFFMKGDGEYIYTDTFTQEKLLKSKYNKNPSNDIIICPLCKKAEFEIEHKQTLHCPECGMKINRTGNILTCKIDNKKLNFYTNLNKFNL